MIVVAGQVTLRTPDGERELNLGGVVRSRAGSAGGHQVRNRADEPARVVIVSTMLQPEVAEYPDSGKIVAAAGVPLAPGEEALLELPLRKDDAVGYWEGSLRSQMAPRTTRAGSYAEVMAEPALARMRLVAASGVGDAPSDEECHGPFPPRVLGVSNSIPALAMGLG